eukprot:Skav201828  [mRNA]  locus=scaffold1071:548569:558799:- [translate_table: standard]
MIWIPEVRTHLQSKLKRHRARSSKGPLGPPLAIAARCGRLEVVRVLLDYGCDPSEIEVSKHKLPEAAKSLLGYLVPKDEAVLQKGLPLRRLRRTLAVQTLLPLARKMRQQTLDSQLVQVLVLGCEHAAPLPDDSLESLVQLCRSLLMSFDSSSMDLGLRLASCLCEVPQKLLKERNFNISKDLAAMLLQAIVTTCDDCDPLEASWGCSTIRHKGCKVCG